jgi:hypothetical protein
MSAKPSVLMLLPVLIAGCSVGGTGDPPGLSIDPPPAPLAGLETLPRATWVLSRDCSADRCGAGYNADPLFLSVDKQKACCGEAGYSLEVTGSARGCSSVSYYLVWSERIKKMKEESRTSLISRHAKQIATSIAEACRLQSGGADIPELPKGVFE